MGTFWARQDEAPAGNGGTSNGGGDTSGSGVPAGSTDSGVTPADFNALPVAEQQAPGIVVQQQDTSGQWIAVGYYVQQNTPLRIRISGYPSLNIGGQALTLTITDPMGNTSQQDVEYNLFQGFAPIPFTPQLPGLYTFTANGPTDPVPLLGIFLPNAATVSASVTVVGAPRPYGAVPPQPGGSLPPPGGFVAPPAGPMTAPGLFGNIGNTLKTGGLIAVALVGLIVLSNLTKGKS